MALTASTMLSLGTKALDFNLPDVVTGERISLASFADKEAILVMFICQHCPFVKHIKSELSKLGKDYLHRRLGIVAISANDAEKYPDDAPAALKKMAIELDLQYPICHDETQDIAKLYTAACTPDFFLFDKQRKLVYRGQLDDSRPSNGLPVTGSDLRAAIDAVLAGKEIVGEQKPSIGCNIKWKPGNEPSYFG
ncbi:alkyl hydroperoxide reductase/ thiol specific antioxidant/ Mal allergen [Calothrix sp. NIES-4101]|nr:alkyl hydroperoxide reductase/ thiol specific antioxidant/ Mal allergen [Calothrix sp. NIES-4101]